MFRFIRPRIFVAIILLCALAVVSDRVGVNDKLITAASEAGLSMPSIGPINMPDVLPGDIGANTDGGTAEAEPDTEPATAAPDDAGAANDDKAETPSPVAQAEAIINDFETRPRDSGDGYERDEFGSGWSDLDEDGCKTRNEILARDLAEVTYREGGDCIVATGTLVTDPFTGDTIDFVRGPQSGDIHIEHVVALSDAWQKGAQDMSPAERERFANDPLHLIAVDGPTNSAKGDADAASWLPPNDDYHCEYAATQVLIKDKYGLWMTLAEQTAIKRVLGDC